MKRIVLLSLAMLSTLFISCDDLSYDQGYEAGKKKGVEEGYLKGHSDGYADGLKDGLTKSDQGVIRFDESDSGLWKIINIISVITIFISLIIVIIVIIFANFSENEWRKRLAKFLVLLPSLLTAYLTIPKINFLWFFNPGFGSALAFLVYGFAVFLTFFLGRWLVNLFFEKTTVGLEMSIIFVSSFILWFIAYLLINNRYLFGNKPMFGNNLIICLTIGIIAVIIYSLLYPQKKESE